MLAAVRAYREAMRDFAPRENSTSGTRGLDVERLREEFEQLLGKTQRRSGGTRRWPRRGPPTARTPCGKLTEIVDGVPRIVADPPLIVPLRDLSDHRSGGAAILVRRRPDGYRRTLQSDRRVLIDHYDVVDVARKVVGVGSVGTRCWIVLLTGRHSADPLVLQIKEAQALGARRSTRGRSVHDNQGERVVSGQRLMQSASDIFLGWASRRPPWTACSATSTSASCATGRAPWTSTIMVPPGMELYGRMCGWTLARAHARSGDRIAIAAYLGKSDVFDEAITEFSAAYADQNERDHEALAAAAASGRIQTADG